MGRPGGVIMGELYIAEATREGSEIVGIHFAGDCFKKGGRVVLKSKEEMMKEHGDFGTGSKIKLSGDLNNHIPANWGYAPEMVEWAEKRIVFVIKKINSVFVVLEGAEETIPMVKGYTYTVAMIQHEKEQTKDFWESLEVL